MIAHDIRSTHNVGAILRTAEGLGVDKVWLTGYTPYPAMTNDTRLPYIAEKLSKQINKTALGAENMIYWQQSDNLDSVLRELRQDGYTVAALEQSPESVMLNEYETPDKIAIVVGREVEGIEQSILAICDVIIEIPMKGKKESFNVAQAAAIAVYHLSFL